MIPLRIPIRDHAGKRCTLHPIRQRWLDEARGSQIPPQAAARLRHRLDNDRIADLTPRSALYGLIAAAFGLGALFFTFDRRHWPIAGGIAGVTIATILIGNRFRVWMFRREIATAFLDERLCPACAYELRGQPRDPRGLTTCPECGASWIVPSRP